MEGSALKRGICEDDGIARGASCGHPSIEGDGMTILSGCDYEVFLSFRGPDIRAGFADFLYTSLKDVGIRTFKDDEDLYKGEEFAPELLQAIKQSKILIPIFSKDYASSAWCLKEVVQMVECKKTGGQKIMPIFYDVAPKEVRYQTGDYENAFLSHESKKRYDQKTIKEWKDALTTVTEINGWDLQSMPNRREGEFVRTFSQKVFNELKKAYLEVSDCLVGVDDHVDNIMEMIGARTSKARIIVIHGMGGVGKTTIAKIVYNQLSKNFDNCCFLSNIREMSERKGIECLQNQLISDILRKEWTDIKNIDEGTQTIKYMLPTKQVLLLLDDVHDKIHMDALIGDRSWFRKGSKVIITSRNKDIFKVPEVDGHYEVTIMDSVQSLQLFSKHAFRRDSPLDNYIHQSNKAIGIAGGLPLALEVIGSLLSRTRMEMWDVTLHKLANIPHVDVRSKLEISYNALEDEEKYIFLEIACFFIGYDKDIMVRFWDASKLFPKVAMEVLQNMSLIKIKDNNTVWMHDQLRDLGRMLVRQESKMNIEKQSRVWNPEDALKLLRRHKGNKEVEALRLKFDHEGQYRFTYEGFDDLSNLRFLAIDGLKENFSAEERLLWHKSTSNVLPTNDNLYLLPRLRWLSWCNIPPTFNVINFSMEDVVILDLSRSDIMHDWKGWSHMEVMKNLEVLNLTGCNLLERTPTFSTPVNIEHLILQGCKSLIEIDRSICQLKRLVYLDARNCENLRRLPNELCGALASLEYLNLSQCIRLERLPDSIGNLESLIELNICRTWIKELPNSIRKLRNLKVVETWCSYISKIPNALWMMEKLEEIKFYCEIEPRSHVKVGKCIYMNQSLRILRLRSAHISTLPRLPESLITLELSWLYMDMFPDISNLTNLKVLNLVFGPPDFDVISNGPVECPIPRWIGNLTKLQALSLQSYYVTTSSTDLSLPPQLKSVYLDCSNLRCLPRLPLSLSSLHLYDCKSLWSMEDLSNLKKLSSLQIVRAAITEIEGLGCLENLRDLQLSWLGQVKKLPDLSNLNKLKHLQVRSCDKLDEIQGELPQSLDKLSIYSCLSLQKLPDLLRLMSKTDVEIDYCDKLLEYARMNQQKLEFVGFKQLRILPDLSKSNALTYLQVEKCDNLVEIQGELPESLIKLKISSCKSLQKLPDLSSLKELQEVDIEDCMILKGEAILSPAKRSRANLWENLQCLRICGLGQVEILHDLSNLSKLRCFQVEDCGNLLEIQGELPESLEELVICSCKSLWKLPDLSSLNGLQKVKIHRCYKLNVDAISRCCSQRVLFEDEDGQI